MIDFDEQKSNILFKEPEPEVAEAVDPEVSADARLSAELEPAREAKLEQTKGTSTVEVASKSTNDIKFFEVLVATSIIGFLGLSAAGIINTMVTTLDGMATPKLESMAETLDRAAQGLPEDTELFGSFKGNGTVSYSNPESGELVRAESIDASSSRFEYEVEGTVDDYSILLSYERGSEQHLYSYDSATDRITESVQEEKG